MRLTIVNGSDLRNQATRQNAIRAFHRTDDHLRSMIVAAFIRIEEGAASQGEQA
ncbi:MAG: hypothetical protein ABIO85_06510 [Sphingomicrobium sp.]